MPQEGFMVIPTTSAEDTPKPKWMNAAEWLRRNPGVFGRDTFYARIRDKTIPCVKAGRKILVPEDLLDRIYEAGQRDA